MPFPASWLGRRVLEPKMDEFLRAFSLWDDRLSGNLTYYVSEAKNFTGTLGAFRDDVDPDGINGRNGGLIVSPTHVLEPENMSDLVEGNALEVLRP